VADGQLRQADESWKLLADAQTEHTLRSLAEMKGQAKDEKSRLHIISMSHRLQV
jgi:hypothetical protein